MKKTIEIEANIRMGGHKVGEELTQAILVAMFGKVELEFVPLEFGYEITDSIPRNILDISFVGENGSMVRFPLG
jgi:hypothetical protein